ncbi:transketolase [Streptococcus pneumoniae]|nr:transketolase [Streptococcus pneumoniae]
MSLQSVNAIRFLGVDAINKSNSGHPGIVMGAAPMAYSLFTKLHLSSQTGLTEIALSCLRVMDQCYCMLSCI